MRGRKLSEYVQHPLISSDMIINRVRKTKRGIRGTLKDEGRQPYETA